LIRDSVDRSLRQLKTDCIDVMLLHSCEESVLRRGEALSALARAREAGKIRFAG
jgi:aryl-alcohol dehydrogenase-like predicted oxidoreductase